MITEREGPIEQVIPEQRFLTCSGCKYHRSSMVRSGREPLYMDNCDHLDFQKESSIFGGNLQKNFEGKLITPSDCPFLRKEE